MMWRYEYNNDVGVNDEGFWEWWDVLYGNESIAKAKTESAAKFLVDLLNEHRPVVDVEKVIG